MAGMNPGFAKYLAEKKAGTVPVKQVSTPTPQMGTPGMHVQLMGTMPQGKRHSKVKIKMPKGK